MVIHILDSVSIPSDPVYVRVYVVSYAKFTPKQKATTLTILRVPSATVANWPYFIAGYRTWGAYAASDDVNVPAQNLLEIWPHKTIAS